MRMNRFWTGALALAVAGAAPSPAAESAAPGGDPYLHALYDRLHDSPQQRKFRQLSPWPAGVVFIEHPGMTKEDFRRHFRLIRELGFNCLKQLEVCPTTDRRAMAHLALDEGLVPWWYAEAGAERPTPELLRSLGLSESLAGSALTDHPVWQQRQVAVMRSRLDRADREIPSGAAHETDGLPGTLKRDQYGLSPESAAMFTGWLRDRYGSVESLKRAWNFDHTMVRRAGWTTWAELEADVVPFVSAERQEYRRIADVYRFRADAHLLKIAAGRDAALAFDADAPVRNGGEMSLFLPFAARSTDMEGIAGAMREGGSFYPSMHPGWHFEEVDFEYTRPIYMQASLAVDWFKGGWAGPWEATGGPQALSGGKSPFVEETRNQVAGFTLDENTQQQLMLSWVAAGFKGFGLWCWNGRSFGWEGGEYALLDRNQQVTPRAIAAGKIAQASRRLRDELWAAHKEPLVGVFQDFESDSFYAAVAVGGRDMYKQWPMRARVGVARALIDANIPWEHVTARNLRAGLADRYRCIYLPAQLAIDAGLLKLLREYVERGGRVVLDAPAAWYGYDGRLLPTSDGTPFEQLFGCRIGDYQYSRANHTRWSVDGHELSGFVLDLQPTRAGVLARFQNGRAAITEHRLGKGSAVIIGFEASLGCWRPGNSWLQQRVAALALGRQRPPYRCDGAIAYRLAAPGADHYFLLNDGPAERVVELSTDLAGATREDAITGERLSPAAPIALPPNGARWIRLARPPSSASRTDR